jgi:hypothetical protein
MSVQLSIEPAKFKFFYTVWRLNLSGQRKYCRTDLVVNHVNDGGYTRARIVLPNTMWGIMVLAVFKIFSKSTTFLSSTTCNFNSTCKKQIQSRYPGPQTTKAHKLVRQKNLHRSGTWGVDPASSLLRSCSKGLLAVAQTSLLLLLPATPDPCSARTKE